jgi:mannitol/fructose-specific phosphotransferase system IIA component (Ntr-type)
MLESNHGHYGLQLSSLITEATVQTKVTVGSWEEATEYVGNLLLKAGKIEAGYISAMKRVLKEMGPYAVIAPGIALLHARPEDGVVEPCLGLITLLDPVPFGHSQNDPVDIVFALGATDKQSHILALQQLSNLLGKDENLKSIRAAQQGRVLVEIFSGNAQ